MKVIRVFWIPFIVSCTSPQATTEEPIDTVNKLKIVSQVTDTLLGQSADATSIDTCEWLIGLRKTKTRGGNFIEYKRLEENSYVIAWGNSIINRVLSDTFYCNHPPPTKPRFERENNDYIMMSFGCGTSCWGSLYLPLHNDVPVKKIYYEYAVDLNHHLVVSLDEDEFGTFIAIHNLRTPEVQRINLTRCDSAIPTYCLDSLSINGKYLYYRWFTELDNKKAEEHTIKIR